MSKLDDLDAFLDGLEGLRFSPPTAVLLQVLGVAKDVRTDAVAVADGVLVLREVNASVGQNAQIADQARGIAAGAAAATASDREQTALDRIATAADRQQTALDRAAAATFNPALYLAKTAARHWFLFNCTPSVAAGQTRFLGANRTAASAADVYAALPRGGTFRKMTIVTAGAPGAAGSGESWAFTLQNLFSDTAMTTTIGPGSNMGVSTTPVTFADNGRFCVKAVSSAGAAGTGSILVSLEFEPNP